MPYYYYGFDWTYIDLVLPCLILSLRASAKVNSTFKKYSRQRTLRGLTAQEAAMRVLSANGVSGVRIERVSGNLTDHYDPRANVIRLSDSVYDNTSTAAIGVACHEALQTIESTGILTEEEQKGARKTLVAAALTYVAATATALAQLLRLIVLFGRRSNNNRR